MQIKIDATEPKSPVFIIKDGIFLDIILRNEIKTPFVLGSEFFNVLIPFGAEIIYGKHKTARINFLTGKTELVDIKYMIGYKKDNEVKEYILDSGGKVCRQ